MADFPGVVDLARSMEAISPNGHSWTANARAIGGAPVVLTFAPSGLGGFPGGAIPYTLSAQSAGTTVSQAWPLPPSLGGPIGQGPNLASLLATLNVVLDPTIGVPWVQFA